MKYLIILLTIFISFSINGQPTWNSLMLEKVPEKYKTHSILYRLGKYYESGAQDVMKKVNEQGIVSRQDGRIYVEIANGEDLSQSIDQFVLTKLGLEINHVWKNFASCWVNIRDVLRISENLPDGYCLSPIKFPMESNEGPLTMNSDSYRDNYADGEGISIAIIDVGFDMLTEARTAGFAPPIILTYDWSGTGLENGSVHGTACLETVYDHAPGAVYSIHKVVASTADFGNAIDESIALGVDIISHSLSWFNTGWDDGSGPICSAIEDATDAGILFFTSAGNENRQYWQGSFVDNISNDIHEWSGTDEGNNIIVPAGATLNLYLEWNGSRLINNYDLWLKNASTNLIIETSVNTLDFEYLSWLNDSGVPVNVYFQVVHNLFGTPDFEIIIGSSGFPDFEYFTEGATICPSNSLELNCLSVGAVNYSLYPTPNGLNPIEGFSSHGPTNGGNQSPDLVGPDGTTTLAYGGAFSGTSCATPNVAGATAAFWSGHPYLSASGVRYTILRMAELYNDWGDAGTDYIYGRGGLRLCNFSDPTRFVDLEPLNLTGNPQLPFFSMEQADANAPVNSTVIFLGGSFNAEPGHIYTKHLLYKSLIQDSIVR